ncbi:adenylosuccinate lyase [Acidithrix sp. C25]|uniref:adenylosuccinate lyase n=1 Tax=Acidithrix sp. C25 TaxID=1671482 RepID=UPI00191BC388|nr:adenylosuccinate lyase [Acidithrix sp. C25]
MIDRYTIGEIGEIFSDESRMTAWLEVELLTVEALATLGKIPSEDAILVRRLAPKIDRAFVDEVGAREAITNHDLAAFVDVVQSHIGVSAASWVHYGLTSSDVVDTALSVILVKAGKAISGQVRGAILALYNKAVEYKDTVMAGRTHGMHAEPTTFGNKLALFCLALNRDYERLERAISGISVGKLSGAVGTYSNIDPEVEKIVCGALGLTPTPATQVIARDRHAEYVYALTSMAATIETIATEIRHLARTELGEAQEYFQPGQKGSSAMPHKRNPILSERLVGLSRVMRGYLISSLEDIALWHERDISHSSVERVIMPDASILAYYMANKLTSLISGLVVDEVAMKRNLDNSFGLVFSQSLLLAIVDSGRTRDDAYRIVQGAAARAIKERRHLRLVLEDEASVQLDESVLDAAFDAHRIIANASLTLKEASKIPLVRNEFQ